jgi:hemoglobin
MVDGDIPVSGVTSRQPAHPSITPAQISNLVDTFYGRVRKDERLGPIFDQRVAGDWTPHLDKMKGFWRSVLLKTGEYKGRPVPVHVQIGDITDAHYVRWLELFRETVAEVFEPAAQGVVIEAAERIASSLWLATSGNVLARPPNWSPNGPQSGQTTDQSRGR